MKIAKPKIKHLHREDVLGNLDYLEGIEVVDQKVKQCFDHTRFDSCRFQKLDLTQSQFIECDFVDIIFDRCDLSNLDLSKHRFLRVHLINCKMVGTDLGLCHMQDIKIENCMMNYTNFFGTTIKYACLLENQMQEASFIQTIFKNVLLTNNDMTRCELMKSDCRQIDFSHCEISGIQIDYQSLKGMKVNMYQAVELAVLLGVEVV